MTATILDPAQIRRRSRWDPLRCYLALRRTLEPHWYRSLWQNDAWGQFENQKEFFLRVDCSASEDERLLTLDCIPSAVSGGHARVLYWLARHASAAGDVVEIGADHGKSTIALSWGASKNEQPTFVHSVDPFPRGMALTSLQRVEIFKNNLTRFEAANVCLHQMYSGDYRRERQEPVRLLFVDAAHDYLNSRFDFLAWQDLISPGGFLAAHDVDNYSHGPGTRRAFMDCILANPNFRLVLHVDNLAVAQKILAAA
jgi:predicted O-methyltransferase YrrM